MSQTEPVAEFNESFSEPGATAPPWTEVAAVLTASEMFWLSTVRRGGRPHVTPLPAIWLDGTLYFCTGSQEQKTANLGANPGCVLTTGTSDLRSGLDVVVEGPAVRMTDVPRLHELAAIWKSNLDWDYEVTDDGFRDGAGRTGLAFGVTPAKILAFGKAPYTQTRYRLPA
ncbi:MAG: pyridoxamine 5'-phosphate oxidase family protein [Trebonia sp.]